MRDACPPPPRASKFFRFHAVFRKIWQNHVFTLPPRVHAPPRGNPGSATDVVYSNNSSYINVCNNIKLQYKLVYDLSICNIGVFFSFKRIHPLLKSDELLFYTILSGEFFLHTKQFSDEFLPCVTFGNTIDFKQH